MADFCWQCTEEFGLATGRENDFRLPDYDKRAVLCEGCGHATVDREGRCLNHNPNEADGDHSLPHDLYVEVPSDSEIVYKPSGCYLYLNLDVARNLWLNLGTLTGELLRESKPPMDWPDEIESRSRIKPPFRP